MKRMITLNKNENVAEPNEEETSENASLNLECDFDKLVITQARKCCPPSPKKECCHVCRALRLGTSYSARGIPRHRCMCRVRPVIHPARLRLADTIALPDDRWRTSDRTSSSAAAKISDGTSTSDADDTSIDELAGYFDTIVHIPKKMSRMAEMMYV